MVAGVALVCGGIVTGSSRLAMALVTDHSGVAAYLELWASLGKPPVHLRGQIASRTVSEGQGRIWDTHRYRLQLTEVDWVNDLSKKNLQVDAGKYDAGRISAEVPGINRASRTQGYELYPPHLVLLNVGAITYSQDV